MCAHMHRHALYGTRDVPGDCQHQTDLLPLQRISQNLMLAICECREKELDVDEEYDVDGGLDMYESRKKKGTKVQPSCHPHHTSALTQHLFPVHTAAHQHVLDFICLLCTWHGANQC